MSDLSWLNPTPHAIAVYASRPLSPVAAQHSLPSGRYSLLGPDFHRLDRTSLRLAHSLDHLVGAGEQCRPPCDAEVGQKHLLNSKRSPDERSVIRVCPFKHSHVARSVRSTRAVTRRLARRPRFCPERGCDAIWPSRHQIPDFASLIRATCFTSA